MQRYRFEVIFLAAVAFCFCSLISQADERENSSTSPFEYAKSYEVKIQSQKSLRGKLKALKELKKVTKNYKETGITEVDISVSAFLTLLNQFPKKIKEYDCLPLESKIVILSNAKAKDYCLENQADFTQEALKVLKYFCEVLRSSSESTCRSE